MTYEVSSLAIPGRTLVFQRLSAFMFTSTASRIIKVDSDARKGFQVNLPKKNREIPVILRSKHSENRPQTNIKNFKACTHLFHWVTNLTSLQKNKKNTSTFAKKNNIIWMLGNQLKMWVFMDLLIGLHPFKPTSLPLPVTGEGRHENAHTFRCSASLKRTPDKLEVETSNRNR